MPFLKGWLVFDKYYSMTTDSPYYAAALVLHPENRIQYIRTNWKKAWQKPAEDAVRKLWIKYREKAIPTPLYEDQSLFHGDDEDSEAEEEEEEGQKREPSEFELAKRSLKDFIRPSSQDEYEIYISQDAYKIGKEVSALQWWRQEQQQRQFPRLSAMALDILSIPGMSDEPERLFSGTRRTISWERSTLGAKNIEKGECLKHWKRSGLVKA